MAKAHLDDTIVAISTAVGQGGIGIVRISGPNTFSIADKMFLTRSGQKPSVLRTHTVHYGWIVGDGPSPSEKLKADILDEGLLTVMRAPKSYTKEDVVEVSSHGGVVSLKTILHRAMELGARLAEPGEFTKRAFLNGRIDLAQAEAVLDIIQSKTDAFLKVSVHQLKGDLTLELESIRENLMAIYVELEAAINFPEDDINVARNLELLEKVHLAEKKISQLLRSSDHGRLLKEGIKIVICGKPNVGKSSLLNVLLREPRAIVSPIAGTTRDTIEETAQIQGIPFQLIDTAGILHPRDSIEEEAVKRSRLSIQGADIVLLMLDSSVDFSKEDEEIIQEIRDKKVLVLVNKCDLPARLDEKQMVKMLSSPKILRISALHRTGIEELQKTIVENVWHGKVDHFPGLLLSNARHIEALKHSFHSVEKAKKALKDDLSAEFISEEIKTAVDFLDVITGRNMDADLLDKIFSQFCIGK